MAACTLAGQEFPELEGWRAEGREENRRKPFLFGGPAAPAVPPPVARLPAVPQAPILRVERRVGRNDPCPCGSGKKFKKCCVPKGDGGGR